MKRNSVSVAVALMMLAVGSIQASAQRSRPAPEDAIRAADQQWMKVFADKDLEKSVVFCAADGSVLAPNAPIAVGRDAIGKLFSGFFALPGLKIGWHPDKAQVAKSGELGYTSGVYQMTFNDPSGKPVSDTGKYVTIWKKQSDGSWKVLFDIFNSDLPPPANP
jgi:ketosteroid isomerase-like protein